MITLNADESHTITLDAGGVYVLVATGTFDGASVALAVSVDGGSNYGEIRNAVDGSAVALTQTGAYELTLPPGTLRATMSSAGGSSDVDLELHKAA